MLMMCWDFGGSPTKWNDLALLFRAENAASSFRIRNILYWIVICNEGEPRLTKESKSFIDDYFIVSNLLDQDWHKWSCSIV
jgi:hypothetical protein